MEQPKEPLDCTSCSAVKVRNYLYEGIPVYIEKDKVGPLLEWLEKNYIDIRLEATRYKLGYILSRNIKIYPNPLKG